MNWIKKTYQLSFLMLISIITFQLSAQSISDTIKLEPFNITASRSSLPASFVSMRFDSIQRSAYLLNNISDFFSQNSGLHMKTYGLSGISTITFRGTGSNHSKVYWNGLALNSPMLGQADARHFPMAFIDDIELQPGAGSTLEGQGAIGGNVILNNEVNWKKDNGTELVLGFGSFNTFNERLKVTLGSGKWRFVSTVYHESAENDFEYSDYYLNNQTLRRSNAEVTTIGGMQEIYHKLNANNTLTARSWYYQSNRELPGIMGLEDNAEHQSDKSSRNMIGWQNSGKHHINELVMGYIWAELDYRDDLIDLKSISEMNSFQLNNKGRYFISKKLEVRSQVRLQHDVAESAGYGNIESQSQLTAMVGFDYKMFKNRLVLNAFARQVLVDDESSEVLPTIGFNYKISKKRQWKWRSSIMKNVNYPTLNDKYWINSGNPDLEPEESIGFETGLVNDHMKIGPNLNLSTSFNLYKNNVDNWIIWTPNNGVWRPANIRSVINTGLEWMMNANYKIGKSTWTMRGTFSGTNTHDRINQQYQIGASRRLIYIPNQKATAFISWNYKTWQIWYRNAYTGIVYINAENTKYLPDYFVQDVGVQRELKLRDNPIFIRFNINNLMNTEYQVIADRPMPGRYYSTTINFQF